ncbi:MAG: molybdenum cofactor guanylyltransferase [Verrucomicrobiota bacterium]|nr:molybdenum cofactor guanylyltransferase [Verrucomicrobiota bacterium]
MGTDKAFVEVEGEPLWQRQLRMLQELHPHELFISAPARDEWSDQGYVIIPDAQKNSGPLAGVVSALRRSSTPLLLALAVDLPCMTSDYLRHLLTFCSATRGLVPRDEPLVAVYPKSATAFAESCLASGRYAMRNFAAGCVADGLAVETEIAPADERLFLNMNTLEDLASVAAVYDRRIRDPQCPNAAVTDHRYR